LLVHGFALDRRMWEPNMATLTQRHRVVRCDLRGFGASAPPAGPYSHAADLHALLGELGIERAAVVGLSMGGGVALELALVHPQAVAALVLAGPDLPGVPLRDPALKTSMRAAIAHACAGDLPAARAAWLQTPFFAHSSPQVAAPLHEIVGDYSFWHWRNDDPHVALDPPAGRRGSEVAARTLVLRGEQEVADFVDNCERMARDIPGADSAELAGAGHMSNMDAPAAFDAALLAFLAATGS
jgi:pimeloyl-ACP methyl ester carboxylesterase